MKEDILFSVIIPIYNIKNFLKKCINSVIYQTYNNLEIILVDDGSTDGCSSMCDDYADMDSRIIVLHKENGGLVSARKAGASIAKGDYILCVDGDDWIAENYVYLFYNILKENRVDIICCGTISVYNNKYINCPVTNSFVYCNKSMMKELIYPKLIQTCNARYFAPNVFAKAIRRDLYIKFQMLVDNRLSIGEDAACTIPCIANADSMCLIEECSYFYRINSSSMTRNRKPFDWLGPKYIYNSLINSIDISKNDFEQQIYRKVVHELFLVIKSRFYQEKSYLEIKREIEFNIEKNFIYKKSIMNSHFSNSVKAVLMEKAIKHRIWPLIWLYSKLS